MVRLPVKALAGNHTLACGYVRVPEDCPEEVAALISACTATDPAARPSAEDVVRRLQARLLFCCCARCCWRVFLIVIPSASRIIRRHTTIACMQAVPVAPSLQRQSESLGSLSVASGILSGLQRHGDSGGGLSAASSALPGLQRQGDSAGGASVASSIVGALQRHNDSSGGHSVGSDPDLLPASIPMPSDQAATAGTAERQLRLTADSSHGMAMHAPGGIEMARLSCKSGLTAASSDGGAMLLPGSAAVSLSSLSASDRYECDMPRSYSSAVSVPSSTASIMAGALSGGVSAASPPSPQTRAQMDEVLHGKVTPPALQASSVVVPRGSEPAVGMLRSARSMSSGAAAAAGWRGGGAADQTYSGASPREVKGQHDHSTQTDSPASTLPQGLVSAVPPPVSPFVASRQTQQRRMLPISPFSDQA